MSGYLPFDEDIVPALFKKIKEADYHIPTSVNPLIADLIHRMLQPDPTRRIPFSMIKKHPWLSDSSPLCMQISLTNLRMWFASKLDDEIFNKTLKMEFNFHNLREQQVRDSILRRRDYSFVVGYDLMMNQKMKTHILESQRNSVALFPSLNSPSRASKGAREQEVRGKTHSSVSNRTVQESTLLLLPSLTSFD